MGGFVLPLLLAVVTAMSAWRLRPSVPVSPPDGAAAEVVRRQATSPAPGLFLPVSVLFAAAAAVAGQPSTWAWLVAAAAQVVLVVSQRRVRRLLGPGDAPPSAPERHRRRRTLALAAAAALLMGVSQVSAAIAQRSGSAVWLGVGLATQLAALALALAAGWSNVWVESGAAPARRAGPGAAPQASTDWAQPPVTRQEPDAPSPFTTRRTRSARARGGDSHAGVDPDAAGGGAPPRHGG